MTEIRLTPSGQFAVRITGPTGRTRELILPCTLDGTLALRRLLQERQRTSVPPRTGEPGAPTQYEIEAWLRNNEVKRPEPPKAKAAPQIDLTQIKLPD